MKSWRNITLNFALVSIPMGVVPGVRQEKVSFTTLHEKCGKKASQQWFCESCNEHFGNDSTMKGIEVGEGYIPVLASELEAVEATFDAAVVVSKFVPSLEVASMLIEDTYWLTPGKMDMQNAYGALHQAMSAKHVVAIGRSSISKNEHIVCVSPVPQGLAMVNLSAPDEMVQPDWTLLPGNETAVKLGEMLIEELTGELEPEDFVRRDLERKKLLVRAKVLKTKLPVAKQEEIPTPGDFLLAIKESIDQVKKNKPPRKKTRAGVRG